MNEDEKEDRRALIRNIVGAIIFTIIMFGCVYAVNQWPH